MTGSTSSQCSVLSYHTLHSSLESPPIRVDHFISSVSCSDPSLEVPHHKYHFSLFSQFQPPYMFFVSSTLAPSGLMYTTPTITFLPSPSHSTHSIAPSLLHPIRGCRVSRTSCPTPPLAFPPHSPYTKPIEPRPSPVPRNHF